jgi:hypothetical protein
VKSGKSGDQPILLHACDGLAHIRQEMRGEIVHQQQRLVGCGREGDVGALEKIPYRIQRGLSQKAGLSSLQVACTAGYPVL